jgi:hypothetical protein
MTRLDLAEQGLQGFHLPHVGGDELGLGPTRSRQGLRGLAAAHHHLGAGGQETAGNACTDALGTAGDQDNLAAVIQRRRLGPLVCHVCAPFRL